ncbi:MAG: hypothetical protein FJ280_25110 [Planctomycetes bacterium]|nr:hypothetical protein [Planctomycetota bacterium]
MSWPNGKSRPRLGRAVPRQRNLSRLVRLTAVIVVVVLAAVVLANGMTKDVGRDEQMYCTAGVLLARGQLLYRDFSFISHPPYHSLLLAAFYRALPTSHYLLVGRLVSVLCEILVILAILGVYRSAFGKCEVPVGWGLPHRVPRFLHPGPFPASWWGKPHPTTSNFQLPTSNFRSSGLLFGLGAVVLSTLNPLVEYASGYAWNHNLVILCVMLALWLFISTDFQKQGKGKKAKGESQTRARTSSFLLFPFDFLFFRTALIGALLTVATFTRITTAPLAVLFLAAVLKQGKSDKEKGKREKGNVRARVLLFPFDFFLFPFFVGAGVALLWPMSVFLRAPQAMWLNLTRIPALCAQWIRAAGFLHDKVQLSVALLTTPSYLILLALAVYLGVALARRWSSIEARDRGNIVLAGAVVLLFFVIAYLPPVMWQQYLAVPVPFVAVALAFPLAVLEQEKSKKSKLKSKTGARTFAFFLLPFAFLLANPAALGRSAALLAPQQWVPIQLHRTCQEMAGTIQEPRRVLTLGPLYALEGNCDIYPELANPFSYRVADRLSAHERTITHTVGPETLDELIRDRPPSGVLLGVEPPYTSFLEDPLRRLVPPTWRRATVGGTLQIHYAP